MISLFDDDNNRLPITWHGIDYNSMSDTEWSNDPAATPTPRSWLYTAQVAISTPFTFTSEVEPDIVRSGGGVEVYNLRTASRVLAMRARLSAETLSERDAWINEIQSDFSPLKLAWVYATSWPPSNTTGRPDFIDQLPLQFTRMDDGSHQANIATLYTNNQLPLEYHVIPLELPDPLISEIQQGGMSAELNLRFLIVDGGRAFLRSNTTLAGNGNIAPTVGPAPNWPTFSWTMTGAGAANLTITSSGISGYSPAALVFDVSGLVNADAVVVNCRDRTITVNGSLDDSIYVSGDFPIFGGYNDTNTVAWTNTTNVTAQTTTFREAFWH